MTGLAHDARRVHLEQGARLQPRLRPEGRERAPLGLLPRQGDVLLSHRLLRQHLRRRPPEPLRRARLPARRDARGRRRSRRSKRACSRTSRARGSSTDHKLVAHHSVVMDPAYVHITRASLAEHARLSRDPARERRLLDRPLRRVDLLLDRGQHRRGARARRGLRRGLTGQPGAAAGERHHRPGRRRRTTALLSRGWTGARSW